jgi:hypothetical protein
MQNSPRELTERVFDAWVQDAETPLEEFVDYQNLIQQDAIVLACTWSVANRIRGARPTTTYQFATDFIAHPLAPALWAERATAAGDWYQDINFLIDYRKLIRESLGEPLMSPHELGRLAFIDGRPNGWEMVTGIEASLLLTLGHAAYNSASGTPYVSLAPFGPSITENHRGFLRYAGEQLGELGRELLDTPEWSQLRLALEREAEEHR